MNYSGKMTMPERISILEKAVALARREISVASLEVLAVSAVGDADKRAEVRTRLLALGAIIDNAIEELELLYEGEAEEWATQGSR